MASNDLWNGWRSVGGLAATATAGVVSISDADAGNSCKYQRSIRVPGRSVVEFSIMARAVSGTSHVYCDLNTVGTLLADLEVTGHTDWRAYTLRFSVPSSEHDSLLLLGVGTYTADLGVAEYRLPRLVVNGVPVLSGTAYNGWRESGSNANRIAAATADTDRLTIDENGVVRTIGKHQFGGANNDPIATAVAGLSIGDGADGRLKSYEASTNNALWSRGSDGEVETYYRVTGAGVNTKVGSISITTTATAYNTSSDYRLKHGVEPLAGASAQIQAIKPVAYNWLSDAVGAQKTSGFIAHELQAVVPQAVTGNKDALNVDGDPEYQGVDASKLVPLIVAALQEALARIEALESNG